MAFYEETLRYLSETPLSLRSLHVHSLERVTQVYPPLKNYRVHMYTISLEVVKTTTIRPRDQLPHTKPLV